MTPEEIKSLVTDVAKEELFSQSEANNLARYFIYNYCKAWLTVGSIARMYNVSKHSVHMSFRAVEDRKYQFAKNKINRIINERLVL